MKILIIEDDQAIVEAISLTIQISWPDAKLLNTHLGERGIELLQAENPDVIILDLGLPDISGFEVLKRIRLFSDVPILILTVRSDETDIVKGLEWGADDYVIKPFRQMELLSRIKLVTRRRGAITEGAPLVCGELQLDPSTGQLFYREKEIKLTPTEGSIMTHLMKNAGRVVTHSRLAEAVWGVDYPDAADSLRVHIRRLRTKLESDPSDPKIVLTRAGVGYLLVRPEEP
ncbi:MAG: response regulator transcription factor [Dehalococcoidales bacterium]|nr:response regulator transcription factor [Dehalococcoidales bacterium]